MRTEHPLTRSLTRSVPALAGGRWRQGGSKQEMLPSLETWSCEGPECDSAGKGRSPGSALTPAGLSHSWAQVFQSQSLHGYLRPGYFFLNLLCAGSFRQVGSESQRKPEAGALCQPLSKILRDPRLSCRAFRLLLPDLPGSWQPLGSQAKAAQAWVPAELSWACL